MVIHPNNFENGDLRDQYAFALMVEKLQKRLAWPDTLDGNFWAPRLA